MAVHSAPIGTEHSNQEMHKGLAIAPNRAQPRAPFLATGILSHSAPALWQSTLALWLLLPSARKGCLL
jgi:hypothetical protein